MTRADDDYQRIMAERVAGHRRLGTCPTCGVVIRVHAEEGHGREPDLPPVCRGCGQDDHEPRDCPVTQPLFGPGSERDEEGA